MNTAIVFVKFFKYYPQFKNNYVFGRKKLEKPRKVFEFVTQCCGHSNWVEWNSDQECIITSSIGCRKSRETNKKCNKFKEYFVCNLYL